MEICFTDLSNQDRKQVFTKPETERKSPEAETENHLLWEEIEKHLRCLSYKKREVFRLWYGRHLYKKIVDPEKIGAEFGVGRKRVLQIKNEVITALTQMLTSFRNRENELSKEQSHK